VTMLMNIGIPYYARKGKLETAMNFENLRMVKVEEGQEGEEGQEVEEGQEEGYQLKGELLNNGNFSYSLNIGVKFYQDQKLIQEENFKQGFYREHPVELNKSMVMNSDLDADYVEIVFANEKLKFLKGFSFALGNLTGE
jgi:hypothetical protein